ncbi:MAG: DUF998 domain-containing protein [Candidatus Korarchaeota archaeon]|nr:DUF998 domain-containing protein [Candidatus Korarchaeota archaeon]NIU82859.1 DUF998 domain-containing protein [Candidatus Thorarchaeota archaeon]NIW12553.1 DUF998 domain-containing protein [Candidatus Thorarchaeota archaeon]NIW50773.1 DUF998 domain-containing protein [Candidatus Korarchaeota archaeon]
MNITEKITTKQSGLCGVLTPAVAFFFISVSILLHPWFQWADNALSDLGALGTSYNLLYNVGMVTTGILGLLFTVNLPQLMNGKIGNTGVLIFTLGLVSLILVGIFPSGTAPHVTVSLTFFALCAVGLTIIGIDQLKPPQWVWGAFVLSLVITGLLAVCLVNAIPYDLGAAIPEAIGALTFSEFSMTFGIRLFQYKTHRSKRH